MTHLKYQQLMIKNGFALCLVGLLGGFIFLFSLLGEISFDPLPFAIDYQVPSSPDRWRAVHTGNIMNGLMSIAFALTIPLLSISAAKMRFVAYGIVATIWGNAMFYIFGALAPNRGLTLGENDFGEGSIAGLLAFWPAIIVAFVLISAIFILMLSVPKSNK